MPFASFLSQKAKTVRKGKRKGERIFPTHAFSFPARMEMKIFKKSSIVNQSEIRSRIIFYQYVCVGSSAERKKNGTEADGEKLFDGRKMSRWPFSVFLYHSPLYASFLSVFHGNKSFHRKKGAHKYMQKTITRGITCYQQHKIYGAFSLLCFTFILPEMKKNSLNVFYLSFFGEKLGAVRWFCERYLRDVTSIYLTNT